MLFFALGVTIVVEWGIYALSLRRRLVLLLGLSLLLNCLTNPAANLLYSLYPRIWLVELLVIAAETPLLRWLIPIGWGRAAALSLAANLVSFGSGLLIFG